MKALRLTFVTFMIVYWVIVAYAQKERNIWCFGANAELTFNSGIPVEVEGCAINIDEGSASIADRNTGQLQLANVRI